VTGDCADNTKHGGAKGLLDACKHLLEFVVAAVFVLRPARSLLRVIDSRRHWVAVRAYEPTFC
jgi:hypothetical protein